MTVLEKYKELKRRLFICYQEHKPTEKVSKELNELILKNTKIFIELLRG